MQIGPRENWITDLTMPFVWITGTGMLVTFHVNAVRAQERFRHMTSRIQKYGPHTTNDNPTPPYLWAKP